MKRIPRRIFTDEFKREAIKLVTEQGLTNRASRQEARRCHQILTLIVAGLNRIRRLRTLHGIRCTHKKKIGVTTDSKHHFPIAPNLLDRPFVRSAPNQVWVADIRYILTDEGWLFLAASKDWNTGEIVGWAMDSRMTKTLVADALRAAYWRKKPKPG